jgi:hypothetical protein
MRERERQTHTQRETDRERERERPLACAEVLHLGILQAEEGVDPLDEVRAADVGRVDAGRVHVDRRPARHDGWTEGGERGERW